MLQKEKNFLSENDIKLFLRTHWLLCKLKFTRIKLEVLCENDFLKSSASGSHYFVTTFYTDEE